LTRYAGNGKHDLLTRPEAPMKTWTPQPGEVERKWFVIDAKDKILGRVAVETARILRGKHKPQFATHMDSGDFVIVINASKVRLTGKKLTQKVYYHHSGYQGGLKSTKADTLFKEKPEKVFRLAVRGMLPKNTLGRAQLKKLKIYAGESHPHEAQKPETYQI
jgi:large subunit ribosomal protein L13